MATWELWRQDDNGNQVRMSTFTDRVEALAKVLALQSGVVHKQTYWIDGPPGPACRTNRDLYHHLVRAGDAMNTNARSLDAFLRGWWRVARPLSGQVSLDLDTVAAMVVAAGVVEPAPLQASWRSGSLRYTDEPTSYADWEAIVLSQIADLADFSDHGPLDEHAYFGIDAPRSPGCRRATGRRWYNFDPKAYLECGMAGALGGWSEEDNLRVPVPGPVLLLADEPEPGERTVASVSWADLAELARCGQEYE